MRSTVRDTPTASDLTVSGVAHWEGRAFGAIVLAAFVLYGVGSSIADRPIGLILVVLNSIAVSVAGLIGYRLVRAACPAVGLGYLVGRVVEALMLAGGIVLTEVAGIDGASNTGYLLAMIALAVGSIPFCQALGRHRWIPRPLAIWGIYGYAALGIGALLELATGRSVAVFFAGLGGLFELILGLYLISYGFRGTKGR